MKFWQKVRVDASEELAEAIEARMEAGGIDRLTVCDVLEGELPGALMAEAEALFQKHGDLRIER